MADSIRGTLLDSVGRPISQALVRVYVSGGALASIFSDKTLITSITNDGLTSPLTEADGSYGPYYTASGRYDVKFQKTGYLFDDTDMADTHVWDEEQSGAAARIVNAPAGGIAATNVQAAINELDTEKLNAAEKAAVSGVASLSADATPRVIEQTKAVLTYTIGGTFAPAGATTYMAVNGWSTTTVSPTGVEADMEQLVPSIGVIRDAYIQCLTNGSNVNLVFTLRKNGADTAIVVTVTAGSTAVFSDITHEVSVVAGDLLNWKLVAAAGAGSVAHVCASLKFIL